jgi:ankyrin repeat protein
MPFTPLIDFCNVSHAITTCAGHIILLAKAWLPEVLLTQQAAVYLADLIEYVCAELLELSGDAARDSKSVVITPRFLLLAIEHDVDLSQIFRDIIYRDTGVYPPVMHRIFAATLTPVDRIGQPPGSNDCYNDRRYRGAPRNFNDVFRRDFCRYESYCGPEKEPSCAVDARDGYQYAFDDSEIVVYRNAEFTSGLTRRQRQLEAIQRTQGHDRDLLAAEFPLGAGMEDLMRLLPVRVRNTLKRGVQVEARSGMCCIERRAIKQLLQLRAPGLSFTHEAINLLILALQHHLYRVLETAAHSANMEERGIVRVADVISAHRIVAFFRAARTGDVDALEVAVIQQQIDINTISGDETALTVACASGSLAAIQWLVARGAAVDKVVRVHRRGQPKTAIMVAAVLGRPDVVRLLLDLGVNINSRGGEGRNDTLLMQVCKVGDAHIDFIQELVARDVNINAKNDAGEDALFAACDGSQFAAAEKLIYAGIDVTNKVKGQTAIDKVKDVASKERLLAAVLLMEEPGLK